MGKIRCKGINNQGSTLIVVIIIVSFISILSTVCISAAMINLKMKTMDRESKKTFYSAEQAVDQIYTGLGKMSMEKLDQAYSEELSTIIRQDVIGGNVVLSSVGNIAANAELRKSFTKKVVENIINTPNSWNSYAAKVFEHDTYDDKLIAILTSYLEDSSKVEVKSVGNIYIVESPLNANRLTNYTIRFDDCVVEYVKDTNGYRANVTFDGVISLPDVVVQFTQDVNKRIDSFKNYSLIGDSGIELASTKDLKITGGAYAGGVGFNMAAGSHFTAVDATIISKSDIRLYGSTCTITGNSNIWCENILLPSKDSSNMACNNATLTIDNTCKTYVKDDIQVDGPNSEVSVSGDYYGYSFAGSTGDSDSSAIIVNGIGSTVDLRGINTLVLGGRAYITLESVATYMTGESLSLKGNQEVYLVPASLITDSSTGKYMSNPTKNKDPLININETNFFGYSYLKIGEPYTKVTVGTDVYIYLNFKTKIGSANYFKSILNDAEFNRVYGLLSTTVKSDIVYHAYQDTRNYMKSILEVNMAQLAQTCLINSSGNSGSSIYTNGSLINASLNGTSAGTATDVTNSTYSIDGITDEAAFTVNALDLSTRYSIVSRLLYNPSMYKMNNGTYVKDANGNYVRDIMTSTTNSIIYDGQVANLSDYNNLGVFENFINTNYLASQTSAFIRTYTGIAGANVMYAYKGDVVIDSTFPYSGGVIVASESVVIKKDCTFNGLIIAGGKISVESNAVIGNSISGYSDIIDFINQCDTTGEFKKYFKCWNSADIAPVGGAGEIKSISDITYKKLVTFDNWIKN